MNQITQRQQEEHFIRLLAAQRQLYEDGKHLLTIWLIATTAIAIGGAVAVSLLQISNAYVVLASLVIIGVELLILPLIYQRRKDAASIQELFDCELLELPWNHTLANKPKPETIAAAAKRHLTELDHNKRQNLQDWYTSESNGLPIYQARIVCQKQNLWWNGELRQEYVYFLYSILIILVVMLGVAGLLSNLTLQQFFSGPVVLFLPLILIGLKQASEHQTAKKRLSGLRDQVTVLWEQASLPSPDLNAIEQETRNIQNEIYHLRSESLPVPTWFYNWRRKAYEELSNNSGLFTGSSTGDDKPQTSNN